MADAEKKIVSGFKGLGISPKLLDAVEKFGFADPTPIQWQSIPVGLVGRDLFGIAQTGTGKTLAFGIPLVQTIGKKKCKGLVVLPTRELAMQVNEALAALAGRLGLRTAVLVGGAAMDRQLKALAKNPHVVVGTPGRVIDHLERGSLALDKVGVLVLDEADRMLDMGFMPQIRKILRKLPKDRQTMMYSATMPDAIRKIAEKYMRDPVRVAAAPSGTTPEKVRQKLYAVENWKKIRLLEWLLKDREGSILVFTRTKIGARKVCSAVKTMGHAVAEIHSDLSLAQRRRALEGFKDRTFRVLVATDIAARGIDVTNIEVVVNYDVPENPEDYVHRIGRTARAGAEGLAVTFASPDQGVEILRIEKLLGTMLLIEKMPELPPNRRMPRDPEGGGGRRKSYSDRGGGRVHKSRQRRSNRR